MNTMMPRRPRTTRLAIAAPLASALTLASGLALAGESAAGKAGVDGEPVTVVYLIRHAETESGRGPERLPNPRLNEAGLDRASHLARLLGETGVTRIFSTPYNRTLETVQPLARAAGLEIELYDAHDLPTFARELRGMTGHVVVSGHSNTTPALVELLGGVSGTPIAEQTEFDRLYVVVTRGTAATQIRLRYGPGVGR